MCGSSRPIRRSRLPAALRQVLRMPIAHGEGNYFTTPDELRRLEQNRQIVFRYVDAAGVATDDVQPERIAPVDRGHLQRASERRRTHAASGARLRAVGRQPGWSRDARIVVKAHAAGAFAAAGERICMSPPAHDNATIERHGLNGEEYQRIVKALGREPSLTELGIFSVMWSEHCSYKSSRVHLRNAADHRALACCRARRERGRRRHRRRAGSRLQDRIAQSPVVHRAVSGRGDRRRRDHPRHFHDGRAADRADELAAVRRARRPARAAEHGRRRRRHRRLREQFRHSDGRRRDRVRGVLHRQPARQCVLSRSSPGPTRSSRASRRAPAIRCSTSARRPAAMAFMARRWRPRSSTRTRPKNGRRCRSAIRSWRSCCSRRASK